MSHYTGSHHVTVNDCQGKVIQAEQTELILHFKAHTALGGIKKAPTYTCQLFWQKQA